MVRPGMIHRVVALLLGAGVLVGAPATAANAASDPARCAGSPYSPEGSQNNREFVDLSPHLLPPAMRALDATCVSKLADEPFDNDGIIAAYNAIYLDLEFPQFVALLRGLENEGWTYDGANRNIDLGDGAGPLHLELSIDELAELAESGQTPWLVQSAFTRPGVTGGPSSMSMQWSDGEHSGLFDGWTTPHLVVDMLLGEPFDTGGIADPSVLSTLRTIDEAIPTATQAAVIGGSAVMLTLIIGYPGSLLGSVVSGRWDRFSAQVRKRFARSTAADAKPGGRRWRQPAWLIWPGFVLSAVISGFIDPAFGANWMSLRVILSALLGFTVFNLAVWMLTRVVILRLEPDAKPTIKFRWGSLVVVVLAVLIARLLEFHPGVIFGLVAGLAFGIALALSRSAIVILLGSAFGLTAAAVGWIGYSLLSPVAAGSGNAVLVFASEFLAGLTIKGVSSLPLALLPLGSLGGATIMRWKKWVWALAYFVGIAAFTLVILAVPQSFKEIPGDFARWIVLFVTFGVLSVAIWVIDNYLSARRKRLAPEPEPEPESEISADLPAD